MITTTTQSHRVDMQLSFWLFPALIYVHDQDATRKSVWWTLWSHVVTVIDLCQPHDISNNPHQTHFSSSSVCVVVFFTISFRYLEAYRVAGRTSYVFCSFFFLKEVEPVVLGCNFIIFWLWNWFLIYQEFPYVCWCIVFKFSVYILISVETKNIVLPCNLRRFRIHISFALGM